MIITRRLLAASVAVLVVVSGCSDDPPPGPSFTTTARLVAKSPDGSLPTAHALQESERILRSRMSAMELIGARTVIDGDGIRVTLPGKHEQRIRALGQTGVLAFREVLTGPVESTGTGGASIDAARKVRQSNDLLASDARRERAVTRALAALNCDDTDDPLHAVDDPKLPLVTCERKPTTGTSRMAYVLGPRAMDNSSIQAARAELSTDGTGFQVMIDFTPGGVAQWSDITGRLALESQARGEPVQVAFVLDTEVVSAPQVTERIEGDTQVSGRFTRDEAEAIAGVLTTQPLPLSFDVTDVQVRRS